MHRLFSVSVFTLLFSSLLFSQKEFTLEDIFVKGTFRTKSVPGFNFMADGRHYSMQKSANILEYDITTGKLTDTLFAGMQLAGQQGFGGDAEGYTFTEDDSRMLIESESESVYRYSTKVKCHVYDRQTKMWQEVFSKGKISNPTFSPDGKKVAFVYENDLYIYLIDKKQTKRVTTDGRKNEVINGMSDWVYEEEFGFTKAYWWSPDSRQLAFIRFDEREVPEFTMQMYNDDSYPEHRTFKYPKVGEKNASVSVFVYSMQQEKLRKVPVAEAADVYVPRLKWAGSKLCVFELNRHQNDLQLWLYNPENQKVDPLYEEKNQYYIDITDDLTFLQDGQHFVWSSEKEGFNQLYLMGMDGKQKAKLTAGAYDVTSFYGVDEKRGKVYFQAAAHSPMVKTVFSVNLDGTGLTALTEQKKGTSSAQFSTTYDYYVLNTSTINTAPVYEVYAYGGSLVRVLEDNAGYDKKMQEYGGSLAEFFSFTTSEQVQLNGWMITPPGFDASKKYPVFLTQYSGPGSQQVTDAWKGSSYWWYQLIAAQGYIVACVDGRGTGARGEQFKKMTYLQLGHYETLDQIETAKYFASKSYVDGSRIGIFGWSYGGFMSSLCILKGNDVFKAAIAVAPVTSWKWYDSVYTERYMQTVTENPSGYRDNSPVYFADRLKGHYLLIHGLADDNVHFQHSAEMARALIKANKQFETYYYPNRNHGIYGDNATIHLYTKMTRFIQDNL